MKDDFGFISDMDFRFRGAGIYGDNFYNQFYLDDQCRYHKDEGPAVIDSDGNKFWYRHGERHRDGDLPAVEMKNGDKAWCKDGKYHRDGKPAIEFANGEAEWWLEGIKLNQNEVTAYQQKLLTEEWRKAADEIVAEIRKGLDHDIRVMKPPKFLL